MKKNTKKEILKLTSFGMKKIFSSILISFILLLNISIPISVFAATPDLLNVSNYTGPENGEVTLIDPMDFSVVFGAPKIPKEVDPPNKNYNVFFQAICLYSNNVTFKMPIGGEESGAHYIISNQSKFEAGKSGGITKIWTWKFSANNMASACPTSEGAPIGVNWTLKEVDSTGNILKEYLNKSFTFKTVKSYNLPGFYYVTIDKNGDYTVSTRFTDETLCGVSSKSFIENNPMFKILEPCKYYNDLPIYNKTNNPVLVTPVNVATNNSIYTMLAPIGGIERMDSSGTDPTCANDPKCITNDIGKYLNIIFKLAIGICAALAVIMLIINGVKYMGDESVFGKTEAKKNMFGAIVGLLIALGAWALLNTINPALTGQNGLSISQASVVLDPEVHGDSPQTAQNGTFCAGKYKTGDAWPSDATERALVAQAGISVNNAPSCTKVGQTSCTSLAGLNTSGVIALKKTKCTTCEIIITGGTECWLHSSKTQHLPGNSIVDLRPTTTLTSYIDEAKNKITSTGMPFPVYLKDNTKFMRESNPDHYHIINW